MSRNLLQKVEIDIYNRRDLKLIKKTLEGSNEAFEKLMSFYKEKVYSIGKGFFCDEMDIDDFVQDVFIKVFTNLKYFKGNSKFSTWILRIAWTTGINYTKKKKCFSITEDIEIKDKRFSPEDESILKITKEAVKQAVSELPDSYAACVELYFFYDITYSEISEIIDIPVNTIKSHIFRAKKILREKLEVFYES